MKYKICKFQDANGKEWYQIQQKGWFKWSWVLTRIGFVGEKSVPIRCYSFEQAKKYIDDQEEYLRSLKTKMLECVEV